MTGPGRMGGPPPMKRLDDGINKPKKLSEYPRYALLRMRGFFSRLFYIIGLVWRAAPFMLVMMALLCIFDGVLPVVGAYISKDLLNEIARLITERAGGTLTEEIFTALSPLIFLFVLNLI